MEIRSVLRNRSYQRLLTANFLSGIGDWFSSVAVLSLLLEVTHEAMAVGITLALRTLPYLLFGPVGGILADRFPRKTILIVCDLARCVIALLFLFVSGSDDVWVAYVATFSLIAFSAVYNPSRIAVIPQIVEEGHVAHANALEQSVFGVVMAIGSMSGGIITALWGTNVAFIFNSLSFLASALLIVPIALQQNSSSTKVEKSVSSQIDSFRGLRQIFAHAPVVPLILLFSLLWPIAGGIVNVLISVYAYEVFDAGTEGIGLLYFSIGIGFLLGGIMASRFHKHSRLFVSISMAVDGLAHLLTSFASSLLVSAMLFCLSTVAGGITNTSLRTLIMQLVPKSFHGRVFALEQTSSNVVIGLSMLAGGWLLGFFPPRFLGFYSGLFITVTSIALGIAIWRHSAAVHKQVFPTHEME